MVPMAVQTVGIFKMPFYWEFGGVLGDARAG
jgi:hypothetical protein